MPRVTILRANPPFAVGTLPSVRRGVKTPTAYFLAAPNTVETTVYHTRPDVVRAVQRAPEGSYIYLSKLGVRQRGVWIKQGNALVFSDVDPYTMRGMPLANPRRVAAARRVRVTRRNPPASRVAATLSTRAVELRYLHREDKGQAYKHAFARGVTVQLLTDGSVRLFRPDGRPLWRQFED